MLNAIWAGMIVLGILYGAFTGNLEAVSNAALESAGEAVDLCITMCGIMGLWTGLMKIAQQAGMIAALTRGISPFVSFLFPRIPKNHPARESISTNIVANVLGLGWAATPAGLKAMEELSALEEDRHRVARPVKEGVMRPRSRVVPPGTASDEMCTFLVLNISSLQLIPVNIIAYRSQYGSVDPAAIIGPAIVATMVSTGVGVIFCLLMQKKSSG